MLINPNSPTAFDPIIAQAKAKGILVIATDQEVTSKDALYVGIDQKAWAMKSAEWLAKTLNGKGNVVCINGVAGHPANQMRVAGYQEVFAKYPGHQDSERGQRQLGRGQRPAGDAEPARHLSQHQRRLGAGRHGGRRLASDHRRRSAPTSPPPAKSASTS